MSWCVSPSGTRVLRVILGGTGPEPPRVTSHSPDHISGTLFPGQVPLEGQDSDTVHRQGRVCEPAPSLSGPCAETLGSHRPAQVPGRCRRTPTTVPQVPLLGSRGAQLGSTPWGPDPLPKSLRPHTSTACVSQRGRPRASGSQEQCDAASPWALGTRPGLMSPSSPEGHRADRGQHGHWGSGRPEAPGLRLPAPRPRTQPLAGLLRVGLCLSPSHRATVIFRCPLEGRGSLQAGESPRRAVSRERPCPCHLPRPQGRWTRGPSDHPSSRSPTARLLSRAPAQPLPHWHGGKALGTTGGEWPPAVWLDTADFTRRAGLSRPAEERPVCGRPGADPSAVGKGGAGGARGDALASGDAAAAQAPCSGPGALTTRPARLLPTSPCHPPHGPGALHGLALCPWPRRVLTLYEGLTRKTRADGSVLRNSLPFLPAR